MAFCNRTFIEEVDLTREGTSRFVFFFCEVVGHQVRDQLDERLLLRLDFFPDSLVVFWDLRNRFDAPTTIEILVQKEVLQEIENPKNLLFAFRLAFAECRDIDQESIVFESQVGQTDVFLGFEMVVQGGLGDPGLGNDLVDPGRVVSLCIEQSGSGFNDMLFDFRMFHVAI